MIDVKISLLQHTLALPADDVVFMPEEREEYVLNDTGRIWVGSSTSHSGRPWNFGQVMTVSMPPACLCFLVFVCVFLTFFSSFVALSNEALSSTPMRQRFSYRGIAVKECLR